MSVDEKIDQLSQRLDKQSLGPIDTISDEVLRQVTSASGSFVTWLRQAVYDQPVITLLFACQFGYALARLRRTYARR